MNLHGYKIEEAEQRLVRFLTGCTLQHKQQIRIIHDKGLHSLQGRAVLKSRLPGWLQQCANVLAYCPARPTDGGNGALYVLLKCAR